MNRLRLCFLLLAVAAGGFSVHAQETVPESNFPPPIDQGNLGEGGLGLPRTGDSGSFGEQHVTLSAAYKFDQEEQLAHISVTALIDPGWHIYSLTQPKGGPQATRITVQGDALAEPKLLGDSRSTAKLFQPDSDVKSHIETETPGWEGLEIQEHEGVVTWLAKVKLAEGVKPEEAVFDVAVRGQVCSSACINFSEKLVAKFEGYIEPPARPGEYEASNLTLSGMVEPAMLKPGSTVTLSLTATLGPGKHVYAHEFPDAERRTRPGKPTLIAITKLAGLELGEIIPSSEPSIVKADKTSGEQRYYEDFVTWKVNLKVPESAPVGAKTLIGFIGFQTCDEMACDRAEAARFEVQLGENAGEGESVPLVFTPAKYSEVESMVEAEARTETPGVTKTAPLQINSAGNSEGAPLGLIGVLGVCLVGGFLLNLMPCVFPFLGLKVLSFAQQAGQSRARVIALNVAYSAGLLSVFLVLATLVVLLSLKWGQQFTLLWFQAATAGVVFAMALSFLGVWEIPIPGFSGKAGGKPQEEGLAGSFSKGIFTTILATPCSGPFLGAVFSFTLGQPAYVTYLIFTFIGLGMALPYLLVGIFPHLVRWLPKPGAWMETFKELMGFVLLATVVYQFYVINPDYFIPALAMCFGIWFGCWIIGRVPTWETLGKQLWAWGLGLTAIAAITAASFHYLSPNPELHLFEWTPYSSASLKQAQSEGKTVMIDFTARWCPTCQYNFYNVINTNEVKSKVESFGVVPLLADWSEESAEIENKLDELKSNSIPLLAIYPANRPGEVILLRDVISQKQLLQALETAGPSKTATAATPQETIATR